jgi:hypothetical protein
MPKIPNSIVTMLNTKFAFSYSFTQHPFLQTQISPKLTINNSRRKQYGQTNIFYCNFAQQTFMCYLYFFTIYMFHFLKWHNPNHSHSESRDIKIMETFKQQM